MDEPVYTVDGEELDRDAAHKLSKRMFWFGFAFLPLLWLMNVWLFWPDFLAGRDAVLAKFTRRSAGCLAISSMVFFPWMLFYAIVGDKYLSESLYNAIDATRFSVSKYIVS